MALKKDKEKVLDEVWTEDRVRSFLDMTPYGDVNADYYVLEKAYRSMRADDFSLFIGFFTEAGRDVNAKSPEGQTLLSLVKQHQQGADYVEVLTKAGAE